MPGVAFTQSNFPFGAGQLQLTARTSLMAINAEKSRLLADLPPCNRPGATVAQHMALPFDPAFNTKHFTLFPSTPQELKNMIWKHACSDPEIISVEVVRHIVEERSSTKKVLVEGRLIKRQFSIKYFAKSAALTLDGEYVTRPNSLLFWRDGVKFACVESHRIYLNAKPHQLRLFKSGKFGIIRFNADLDTISLPRQTRFILHQIGCRRRNYSPWFYGFENVQRIACADEVDEPTAIDELKEEISLDFAETIDDVQEKLFENKWSTWSYFKEDDDWKAAVDFEETKLKKELDLARNALKKLATGTLLRPDVKISFFPMTEKNLLGKEDDVAQDGGQSA